MELLFRENRVVVRKQVELMGDVEQHEKEMSYEELEERQPELTVRSISVERFDDGSLKTICLGDLDTPEEKNVSVSDNFEQCIAEWFGLTEGTTQYDTVTSVISQIKNSGKVNKTTWNKAVEGRVNEALAEDPSRDESSYHYTVRDACVRRQGYEGDGAVQNFLDDVETAIEECT